MNHELFLGSLVLSFCLIALPAAAHPGRTASDGCHYCKTNCAEWGVPQGQRHCHHAPDSTPNDLQSNDVVDPIDLSGAVAASAPTSISGGGPPPGPEFR